MLPGHQNLLPLLKALQGLQAQQEAARVLNLPVVPAERQPLRVRSQQASAAPAETHPPHWKPVHLTEWAATPITDKAVRMQTREVTDRKAKHHQDNSVTRVVLSMVHKVVTETMAAPR